MQRSNLKQHRNLIRVTGLLVALVVGFSGLIIAPHSSALAAKTYTIVFKANAGKGTMPSQSVPSTGKALSKVKFTRSGYKFAGWATSANSRVRYKDRAVIKPRARTYLYARWLKVSSVPAIWGHKIGSLLWSDEFSGAAGSQVNSASWTPRLCGHDEANGGGTCHNDEPQWYTPDAIALDGSAQGNAVITTTRVYGVPANAGQCLASSCHYTSGRFDTQGKVSFRYGYIEARMKMPTGGANWPAFWALGDSITSVSWPRSGEIDIAEQGGDRPTRASSAVHYASSADCCAAHLYDVAEVTDIANYQTGFHTYGMAWEPNRMEFFVDRELFWIVTPDTVQSNDWSFNEPFFLILNNATGAFGGDYDGWPQSFTTIDYVRAWQLDGQGSVTRH